MIEFLIDIDTKLFLFLNSFHNPFWDQIMLILSDKEPWYPLYLATVIYMGFKYKWYGFLTFIAAVLCVTLTDQISNQLFKDVFERLRPCNTPELKDLVYTVNNRCGGGFSFVSSHATNTAGFAVFTSLLFKKKWYSIAILIWAVAVSYSRVYLGVHFIFDVLGGMLLGAIIGYLVYSLLLISQKYWIKKPIFTT